MRVFEILEDHSIDNIHLAMYAEYIEDEHIITEDSKNSTSYKNFVNAWSSIALSNNDIGKMFYVASTHAFEQVGLITLSLCNDNVELIEILPKEQYRFKDINGNTTTFPPDKEHQHRFIFNNYKSIKQFVFDLKLRLGDWKIITKDLNI